MPQGNLLGLSQMNLEDPGLNGPVIIRLESSCTDSPRSGTQLVS